MQGAAPDRWRRDVLALYTAATRHQPKEERDMDTIDRNDAYPITSLDDPAKIYAKPLPNVATKETDHITEVGRTFIARSMPSR